jgi:hypothetical protein
MSLDCVQVKGDVGWKGVRKILMQGVQMGGTQGLGDHSIERKTKA